MKKIFTLLTFVFMSSALLFGQCPDTATPNPTNKTFNLNYNSEADRDAAFEALASITFPAGVGAGGEATVTVLKADLTPDGPVGDDVYRIRAVTTTDDYFGGENGAFVGVLTFNNADDTMVACAYETSSVDYVNRNSSIEIFPNPVQDQLTLIDAKGEVTIYNLFGQAVKQLTTADSRVSIPVADLLNGQYYLQVLQDDGRIVVRQFSKVD